jgi:hypothetical protein
MSTFDEAVVDIKNARDAIDGLVTNQNPDNGETKHPDPKKHKYISFIKSGFRIIAGGALCFGDFLVAGSLFIVAELLGIAEELV